MENPGTILIVDNNDGVRAVLETAFRQHGFTVFLAGGGREAIRLFRAQPIDIVLLDVAMPDLNGPETLEMLRSIRPDVPSFFMTGGTEIPTETLVKLGAIQVFEKPFRDLADVARIFAELLDKRGSIKHPAHPPGNAHLEKRKETSQVVTGE